MKFRLITLIYFCGKVAFPLVKFSHLRAANHFLSLFNSVFTLQSFSMSWGYKELYYYVLINNGNISDYCVG